MRQVLTQIDGVEEAEVSLDEARVVVRFHPDRVDPAEMAAKVTAIGFPARLEESAEAASSSPTTEE